MNSATSSDTHVIRCDASQGDAWNKFLLKQDSSNFYQRFEWLSINQRAFGHPCYYLAALRGEDIVGVLPLVFIRSKIFGRILASMPFVNFGGPCVLDESVMKTLLQDSFSLSDELGARYLELRCLNILPGELPTATHKVSMTIELEEDPEILWNNFKSKHRTNIRRVYKEGITVKSGHLDKLDEFFDLLSENWRSLGTPIYRKNYFADILKTFPEETRIFVAYRNNKPIASAFNGYFRDTVEGMWACSNPEFRALQPNYVLYWEMIKHACENGYKHYHLGRSTMDTGGESFKKKWNAHASQLYWHYYLPKGGSIPSLNVSNPKFDIPIRIWRKLPIAVTRWIGPFVARSIP